METAGLCHICGRRAVHTCKMCGRPVCGRHYDSKTGIDSSCKRGRTIR